MLVGLDGLLVEGLVVEASLRWSDSVLLSHLEVLAEVLVSAPPVEMDHVESLVPSNLMEVGVADIVLDTVNWEASVSVSHGVELVGLADSVAPVLHHLLLLLLGEHVEQE